jgi:hypothetical protein
MAEWVRYWPSMPTEAEVNRLADVIPTSLRLSVENNRYFTGAWQHVDDARHGPATQEQKPDGPHQRPWDERTLTDLLSAYHQVCRAQLLIQRSGPPGLQLDTERVRQQLAAAVAEHYLEHLFGLPEELTPHENLRTLLEQLRPPEGQPRSLIAGMKMLNPAYGYSDEQLAAHQQAPHLRENQ